MSTEVSLKFKADETRAAEYLPALQNLISREPLGFTPFSSEIEYRGFRLAMGLTAGGHLRATSRLEKLSASLLTNKIELNTSLLSSVLLKGWGTFNVDLDQLSKCIHQISVKPSRSRSALLCPRSSSLFLRLIPPDVFKSICSYLGTNRPWVEPPQILESTPHPKNHKPTISELSRNAFSFHRDIDSIINLKVFINLTSTKGGSHQYIQKSINSDKREVSSNFNFSSITFDEQYFAQTIYETFVHTGRFNPEAILTLYGSKNLISFPTTKGTAWIEDTYGLHRGSPPLEGTRRLLVINLLSHKLRT